MAASSEKESPGLLYEKDNSFDRCTPVSSAQLLDAVLSWAAKNKYPGKEGGAEARHAPCT
jgi:hypothetical protein